MKLLRVLLLLLSCGGLLAQYCEQQTTSDSLSKNISPIWAKYVVSHNFDYYSTPNEQLSQVQMLYNYRKDELHFGVMCGSYPYYCGGAGGFCDGSGGFFSFVILNSTSQTPITMVTILPTNCSIQSLTFSIPPSCQDSSANCDLADYFGNQTVYFDTMSISSPATSWKAVSQAYWAYSGIDLQFTIKNFSNLGFPQKPDLINTPFTFDYAIVLGKGGNDPDILTRSATLPPWREIDSDNLCNADTFSTFIVNQWVVPNYNEDKFKSQVASYAYLPCSEAVVILSAKMNSDGSANVDFYVSTSASDYYPGSYIQSSVNATGNPLTCPAYQMYMYKDYLSIQSKAKQSDCWAAFSKQDFPPNTVCSNLEFTDNMYYTRFENAERQWSNCAYTVDMAKMCGFTDNTGLFSQYSVETYIYDMYYIEPVLLFPNQVPFCQHSFVVDASATYSDLAVSFSWSLDYCYPSYYGTLCSRLNTITNGSTGPILKLDWSDADNPANMVTTVRFRVAFITKEYPSGIIVYTGDIGITFDPSQMIVQPKVPGNLGITSKETRLVVDSIIPCNVSGTVENYWEYYSQAGYPAPELLAIDSRTSDLIIDPLSISNADTFSMGQEEYFEIAHSSNFSKILNRFSNTTTYTMSVTPAVFSYFTTGDTSSMHDALYDYVVSGLGLNVVQKFWPPIPGGAPYADQSCNLEGCTMNVCYPNRGQFCWPATATITMSSVELPVVEFQVLTWPSVGKMLPEQPFSVNATATAELDWLYQTTSYPFTDLKFKWSSSTIDLNNPNVTDSVNDAVLNLKPYYWKYLIPDINGNSKLQLKVTVQATAVDGTVLQKTDSTIDLSFFLPVTPPSLGQVLVKSIGSGSYELMMAHWRDDTVINQYSIYETSYSRPRHLRYLFKYFQTTNTSVGPEVILSPLQYSSALRTKLPSGNITVVGYVYNAWGASSRVQSAPVQVNPQPVDAGTLSSLQAEIDGAINSGNPDAAVTALRQFLLYLNSDPEFQDKTYRYYALDKIKKISKLVNNYEMYSLLLGMVGLLTIFLTNKFPHITAPVDKLDSDIFRDTLGNISKLLEHPIAGGGINPEEAQSLVACFSDTLEFKNKNDELDTSLQENLSSSIWNTENDVIAKLLSKLNCGDPSAVVESPNMNIFVKKGTAGGTFPDSDSLGQSSFVFPEGAISDPCVGGHYVSYASSIFDFTNKNPDGEIIGLDFFDSDGDKVDTSNLDQPVKINIFVEDINLNKEEPSCSFWNAATNSWDEENCKVINKLVTGHSAIVECECKHLTNFTSFSSKKSSSSNSTNIIIAAVCGGAGVILLAAILAILVVRTRGKKEDKEQATQPASTAPPKPALVIIPPEEIVIEEKIGGGAFGEVYKGTYLGTTTVALKKLTSESNTEEFEAEAALLQNLRHTNIVFFLGIYTSEERDKYMVTEFMPKGSVLEMLKKSGPRLSIVELIQLCKDAAAGMSYLEMCKIVHRDLAARNLLISGTSGNYTVKVADFGMSKKIENMNPSNAPEKFPVKWTAPEAIETRQYSTKADVWSFGVTMWEIFSMGASPYMGMTNKEAVSYVLEGKRLSKPEKCPDEVYKLMLRCWATKPESRPTFKQIYSELKKCIDSNADTSSDSDNSTLPTRKVTMKPDYHNENYDSTDNSSNNNHYEAPPAKSQDSQGSMQNYEMSGVSKTRYSSLGRDNIEMEEVKTKSGSNYEYSPRS